MNTASSDSPIRINMAELVARSIGGYGVFLALLILILFGISNRLDWVMAWALVGIYAAASAFAFVAMLSGSRELFWERIRPNQAGAKWWDKILTRLMAAIGPMAIWAVAALDARNGWGAPLPLASSVAALVMGAAGYSLTLWALNSNPFFSAVVRIQTDRGHTVITRGPYQWVRHPGYAGLAVFTVMTPLILGSLWAFIPAAALLGVTALRTALEDRTLQAELPGYADYSQRVRYRLIPGIW